MKKLCDKDFAEVSGELSGALFASKSQYPCLNGQRPQIVQKILWCCSCEVLTLWFFSGPQKRNRINPIDVSAFSV